MPRDSDIAARSNKTAQDNSVAGVGYQVGAQPITVHNSIQGDKTSQMAGQLADALGVGVKAQTDYNSQIAANDTAQGTLDAQTGAPTKANASDAYKAAQDHVHALASWAVDGDKISTDVQKMGFDQNPDPKQGLADMNNWLNDQYKNLYQGSSPSTANTLAPKMQELRNNANKWFQQSVTEQANNKQQADLKTIVGSAFSKSFTDTDPAHPEFGGSFDSSKFDYVGVNKNMQSLYPGKDGNTLFLSQLSELAHTKGAPELLTNMPDRWPDGTPTPKGSGDPATIKAYESAVKQAQAQKDLNLGAVDAANREANKAIVKGSEVSIMDNLLSGRDQTAALHLYAKTPGADPAFIEKAANWQHERFKQAEEDSLDNGQAATIRRDIALGNITGAAQLVAAVDHAGLAGKSKTQILQQGLSDIKSVQSIEQDDPATKMYLQSLAERYKPTTDALGKFDHPAAAQQQADLLLDFKRQALARKPGDNVKDIYDSVQKKYGDPIDADKSLPKRTLTPVNDQERSKIIATADPRAIKDAGLTGADIKRLRDSGQLSTADAAKASAALLATLPNH